MAFNYFRAKSAEGDEHKKLSAIALGYEPDKDPAPKVVAQGTGVAAEQIIAIARENDIPIREDPLLAAALASLEVNEVIPPELYDIIAEILAYIYRIREQEIEIDEE